MSFNTIALHIVAKARNATYMLLGLWTNNADGLNSPPNKKMHVNNFGEKSPTRTETHHYIYP